ncbi:glycerate kinase [Sutcliffiella cohnii]
MKIVIAPDSFKGSISSMEATQIISQAIKDFDHQIEVVEIPMADGGEGTVEALLQTIGGEKITCKVEDPLGRPIEASYGWLDGHKTAIIETASASGLPLLTDAELNPLETSSFGTGQLMKDALDKGAEKVILGLGGSATVDAGVGLFQALGFIALDHGGNKIDRVGGRLHDIHNIDISKLDPRLQQVKVIVASDVTSPLLGENGAVYMFGPQKGVKSEQLPQFEMGMEHFLQVMKNVTKHDYSLYPGSGAAGGIGFTLLSLIEVEFQSGLDLVVEMTDFRGHLETADLVITGEGKIDGQSIMGKVPVGISRIAKEVGVPVVAIAGSIGEKTDKLEQEGIHTVLSIVDGPTSLEAAMSNGHSLLYETMKRIMRLLEIGMTIEGKRRR